MPPFFASVMAGLMPFTSMATTRMASTFCWISVSIALFWALGSLFELKMARSTPAALAAACAAWSICVKKRASWLICTIAIFLPAADAAPAKVRRDTAINAVSETAVMRRTAEAALIGIPFLVGPDALHGLMEAALPGEWRKTSKAQPTLRPLLVNRFIKSRSRVLECQPFQNKVRESTKVRGVIDPRAAGLPRRVRSA